MYSIRYIFFSMQHCFYKLIRTALFLSFMFAPLAYASDPIIWIDGATGNIGAVDVVTGEATVIGNASVILTDIAYDSKGNLWGISFTTLYSINKTTGVATQIGNLGVSDANSLVFGPDGTLYSSGNTSGNLYAINTKTGLASVLFYTGHSSGGDLAFLNGALYYTDGSNLLLINLSNHQTTLIGSIGATPVYGLASYNGILYAVANTRIYSVNISTGRGTLISTYSGELGSAYGADFTNVSGGVGTNDCLFNWAEQAYRQYFSPAGATSATFPPFYYRYYAGTGIYLGVSSTDNNVYVLGGLFGNTPLKIAPVSSYLGVSGCS